MSKILVTIVVPVYGDWTSLEQCIESLINYVSADHKVLLVNDCGPDVENIEDNIKKAISGSKNFSYYRNEKNLGFVGTCNKAVLELDKTNNDILLLNSDTKVTEGFLDEMISVLYAEKKHGVVSPRSNNATLATVPLRSAHNKGIAQDESFKIYQTISPHMRRFNIVPVAHGFCMLIKRELIEKYGLFDTVFGKGYGEEVDFCLRIAKHGYKSVLANRAFVFHQEARSFSMETKSKLLEINNKIIWHHYPNYRKSVQEYMGQAIKHETEIENLHYKKNQENNIKKLVKKYKPIHRLARHIKRISKH